ncbi:MAG TPA: hypothetical protein VFR78_24560 [Pyrinomonadaceae bacterium]|nr:hypothetical protein [Pyrinomonadaceae bacterium]
MIKKILSPLVLLLCLVAVPLQTLGQKNAPKKKQPAQPRVNELSEAEVRQFAISLVISLANEWTGCSFRSFDSGRTARSSPVRRIFCKAEERKRRTAIQLGQLTASQRSFGYIEAARLSLDSGVQALELLEKAIEEALRAEASKPDRALLLTGIANRLIEVDSHSRRGSNGSGN